MKRFINMVNKLLVVIVIVFMLASPMLGQADAQHDALMETMRQMNEMRSRQELQWYQLSERERYLRHHANQAAYYFRQTYGRFPNENDTQWIVSVERQVGIRDTNEESIFLETLFTPYRDHVQHQDRDRAICEGGKQLGIYNPYACD